MRHIVLYRHSSGMYIAECPSLMRCYSEGATIDEALSKMQDVIKSWLEAATADDGEIPADYPIFVRQLDITDSPDDFQAMNGD